MAKRWKNDALLAEAERELEEAWAEANRQGIFKYHDKNRPQIYCRNTNCGINLTRHTPLPKFCHQCGTEVLAEQQMKSAAAQERLARALRRVGAKEEAVK